ncbi:hypothetical protein Acid7E03_43040 [Acidisoma sp. 7E03]
MAVDLLAEVTRDANVAARLLTEHLEKTTNIPLNVFSDTIRLAERMLCLSSLREPAAGQEILAVAAAESAEDPLAIVTFVITGHTSGRWTLTGVIAIVLGGTTRHTLANELGSLPSRTAFLGSKRWTGLCRGDAVEKCVGCEELGHVAEGAAPIRAKCRFEGSLRLGPKRLALSKLALAGWGQANEPVASVQWIDGDSDVALALERFQRMGQSARIHDESRCETASGDRLGPADLR